MPAGSKQLSLITFVHYPFVPNFLSDSLHKITAICATLIISNKKRPESNRIRAVPFSGQPENRFASRIYMSSSLLAVPRTLYPAPSKTGCTMAQFRNEDRIKIPAETVQPSANRTNQATSKTSLHRIKRLCSASAILGANTMQLNAIPRAIRISGPIARVEN